MENTPYPQTIYKLTFAFNGTNYYGWQRQPDAVTVQQTMEDILRRLFHNDSLALSGCSRTDAGVHALGMTASFKTDSKMPETDLKNFLNRQLPHNIRIGSVEIMPEGFNAQGSSLGKSYIYAVLYGTQSLFLKDACWSWPEIADMDRVREALSALPGTHDFQNFTGRKADTVGTVRTIYKAELHTFGSVACFYFSGNGFLYKMIRRIMAFLHDVALKKYTVDDFFRAVNERGFKLGDDVAPARGLYLKTPFYREDEWKGDTVEQPPFFN